MARLSSLAEMDAETVRQDPALRALVEDEAAMRGLIGRKVRYLDEVYEITDVLFDEDTLILSADDSTEMQEDSYGRAHRVVPKVRNLRFRDAAHEPTTIWDDVSFLDGPLLEAS